MLGKIALKKCYQTKIRDQNVAKYFQLLLKIWRFLDFKKGIFWQNVLILFWFSSKKMLMATAWQNWKKKNWIQQRFVFNSFFVLLTKKFGKNLEFFFHSVKLTNLSIFLKEFTKFLHHKIGKKIPYWEELIFSWVLLFSVRLSLFPFHYCWLPQFNENRRWWLMDDLYYSSQKEEQNSFEGCSSSY